MTVFHLDARQQMSGDQISDDIGKPDPKGTRSAVLRITLDENGNGTIRAGQLGPVEDAQEGANAG